MPSRDTPLHPHQTHIRIRPAPRHPHASYQTVPDRAAADTLIDALFKTHPDVAAWAIIAPNGRIIRIRQRDPLAQPSDKQRRLF